MAEQDLDTTIKIGVDGSGVAAGVTSIKRSLSELGGAVKKITDDTNTELAKIGKDDLKLGGSIEKATKAVIKETGELTKQLKLAETQAFTGFSNIGKSAEAAYIKLAGQGVPENYIAAYMKTLKEAQAVQSATFQKLAQAEAQAAAQSAQQAEAKAQHQMRLLALNNQIQASNKATADAQAAQSAKAIKDLKDLTAAQAAYRQEVINSELNFTHTGRGKSTAFLADKGQRLGFDSSFIEKELAGYKKVEDAAKAAFQAANPHIAEMSKRAADAGTSVKGLSASLRNVPAQFTDIVVSLQGGQAPLTVLLQQGGQLKDLFGGVGNAARALGGYVVGLINPFTATAAAVAAVGYAAYQASEDAKALNKSLILSNGASGTTIGELTKVAESLTATGIGAGKASEALAEFITAGVKAGDSLGGFTKTAIELERVGGASIKETAKAFADLGKDPLSNLNVLTLATYRQVEALLEQGDKIGAVKVAQSALNQENERVTAGLRAQEGVLDTSTRYWKDLGVSVWDTVRGLSQAVLLTPKTGNEERQELQKRRDTYAAQGYDTTKEDARLAYFKRLDDAQKESVKNQTKEIELKTILANLDAKDEGTRKLRERNQLIADNTRLLEAGLISQKRYDDVLANFDKQKQKAPAKLAKESSPFDTEQAKAYAKYIEEFQQAALKAQNQTDGLTASQGKLVAMLSDPVFQAMPEAWKQTQLAAAYSAIAIEQNADATKLATKAQAEYMEKLGNAGAKEVAALETRLQKQTQHNAEIGKTAEQIEAVRRVAEEAATAELESQAKAIQLLLDKESGLVDLANTQYAVSEAAKPIYELELKTLRDQIALRKQIAKGYGEGEQKEASAAAAKEAKKAAEDAAKEWQKTADKINDSITDALMRGFESGKGFAENLRDSVVNMFKTMVLRPVVQATVGGTLGVLGMNAAAQPADSGGVGGLLNTASDLKTLYGMKDWFTDFGSAAASSVIRGGEIAYSAGFEKIGSSMMSVSEAGNFTAVSDGLNTIGDGLGYLNAAVAASQGRWGAAIGSAIGTTYGGPLGGAVGNFLGGLVDNLFAGDGGPKLASTGDAIRRYDKGGALTENATNGAWFFTNTDDANKLLDGLESRYQKAAKALGIGTVATQFDYGSNNRGNFALAGAAGNSRANTGEIAYSAEAMQVAASRAVFAALQGSELPKYLSGLLNSVGDINALSQTQIDDLLNTAQAFKGLHDVMVQMPFEALHDLSYDATKGLIEFSGGLDKLTQNLGTYYENFYSAEEKKAQTLKNITQTLTDAGALTRTTRTAIPGEHDLVYGPTGMSVSLERYATSVENLDMPKTREEFRALVDSFKELSGPHAQEAYAALMSVSGAFASVTPAAADAAAALEKDLAARATWQQKLDVLTGKTTEQQIERANDLAGVTDVATIKLIERVHAEQDLTAATAAATAAVEKAAAAQKAITTANQSIALSKATLAGASSQETAFTAADFALQNSIAALDAFKESLTKKEENVTTAEIESLNISDFAKAEFIDELSDLMTGYWSAKAGVKNAQDAIDQAAQQAQAQAEQAAREAAQQRAAAIGQERAGLQSQLDQLTMNSTQLLEKQRAALDESNRALFDNIQAQTAWKAISTQHADLQDRLNIANGTITARQAALQKELAGALDDTSASMIRAIYAAEDQSAANERAAAAAKEQADAAKEQADAAAAQAKQLADEAIARAKALAETNKGWRDQLDVLTGAQTERSIALRDALDESTRALMRQVYAQQDLKSAVEASATASDTALGGIQKALDAQKTAQTQAVNDVKGLFDLLSQSVKDLYGQVDSTRAMQAAEGQAFIATALALYKAGGTLPDQKQLDGAIAAARTGIDGTQFASQVDADFARLALAGQLSQLESAAGAKLTDAQALLDTTNNAYEVAKTQLDTLRGIDTRVLSVAEAVEAFQVAYTGEATARQKLLASAQQVNATVGGRSQAQADSDPGNIAAAKNWAAARIDNLVSYAAAGGNMDGARVAAEVVALQHYINDPSASQRLPSFDVGANYVPRDMIAQIHEGEAVVPAAFNPFNPNAQQGSAGNARLEALVEGLTAEVQRLQAIVNDGNKQTRRTADAVNGNPEMPMLVETV